MHQISICTNQSYVIILCANWLIVSASRPPAEAAEALNQIRFCLMVILGCCLLVALLMLLSGCIDRSSGFPRENQCKRDLFLPSLLHPGGTLRGCGPAWGCLGLSKDILGCLGLSWTCTFNNKCGKPIHNEKCPLSSFNNKGRPWVGSDVMGREDAEWLAARKKQCN